MTTNQTIDGVPRRVCHACVTLARNAYCPVCDDDTAAQPQGEPVAWRSCAAINGKHYITEDSPDQQQERIDKSEPGAYLLASQPLYLGPPEQPTPVAVHEEFEFCKWTHEVIEESRIGGVTIKIQRMQHLTPGEEKSAHDAWMARAALSTKSR